MPEAGERKPCWMKIFMIKFYLGIDKIDTKTTFYNCTILNKEKVIFSNIMTALING